MRSGILAMSAGTSTVGVVRRLMGSRGSWMRIAVVSAARVVLVSGSRGGRDASRMFVSISLRLRLGTIFARVFVTVDRVIVTHGGWSAVGGSWA